MGDTPSVTNDDRLPMKYYDAFISLGLNCQVSSKIRQFCDTYAAYFYNWVAVKRIHSLIMSLDAGMDLLLSESQPAVNDMFAFREFKMFIHGRLLFSSIEHESEERRERLIACAENELIERMSYMMHKFMQDITRIERILFILAVPERHGTPDPAAKTVSIHKQVKVLREKLVLLSKGAPVRDLLVITDKGSTPLFRDSEGLYHRETVLAPGEDALTTNNNIDWCRDIFSEFRVSNDAKFELLTGSVLTPEKECDFASLDVSSLRFSVGHGPSSLLSVFSQLNPEAARRFAEYILVNGNVGDRQFHAEAACLFAKDRRFTRTMQSLLRANDKNVLKAVWSLRKTLKAMK